MTKPEPENQKKPKQVSAKSGGPLDEILKLMEEENLHELEISDGPFQVKLVRQSAQPVYAAPAPSAAEVAEAAADALAAEEEKYTPVKSPLAGIFYRAPSPTTAPFVKEGDTITSEKTLCIVEAMKVLNEINGGLSGKVVKILVENGKPIHVGQTLFLVEPSA